jgi:hypothetical protein
VSFITLIGVISTAIGLLNLFPIRCSTEGTSSPF